MNPLDPGCFGCCIFLPMPKFIQRWMGTEPYVPPPHLTDPEEIKQWADFIFDGQTTVLVRSSDFRVGLGTAHQLADERGYRFTQMADYGGEGWPMVYQFDLINPPVS